MDNFTKEVKDFIFSMDVDNLGIANPNDDYFLNAPEEYRPKIILEEANSVIVMGKLLPKSIFKVKHHQSQSVHRLYHSIYKHLDIVSARLCGFLESKGHYAISVPCYIPLSIRNNSEPWGIISLKHAGVAAGLGQIAKNGLLIHPEYGTMNRLSAVITSAFLDYDKPLEKNACTDCDLCVEICPRKALTKSGRFKKIKCLFNVVRHGLYNLHSMGSPEFMKNMELITNTMLLEYTVGCIKCLEVCPLNLQPLKK